VTGEPNAFCALLGAFQWSPPSALPFAAGQWWVQGDFLGIDLLDNNGEATRTYPVPPWPALVGLHLVFQAAVHDPVTGLWQFTNGSDCFLAQ
jgi:hypothetical protein